MLPFFRTNQCLSLGVLCFALRSVAVDDSSCKSNATHFGWRVPDTQDDNSGTSTTLRSLARSTHCEYQNHTEASREAYQYLRKNVMPFDLPFLETLGFHDDATEDLPDGLDDGMIGQTIAYALRAKLEFNYTDVLPKEIWQEYVLNYANTNEARSNWRPLLWKKLRHLVKPDMHNNISAVVRTVNAEMWKLLAPADSECIVFKSGSTPLIFDPMSIMTFGYASCTGTSILLVNALRTLGIPARMAGTAAWGQEPSHGNHNWVEVYKDGKWLFLEPSPGLSHVDDLDQPPHTRWFCNRKKFGPYSHNTTLVYAARLTRGKGISYPIAWELSNKDVPGEDVSAYYRHVCGDSS